MLNGKRKKDLNYFNLKKAKKMRNLRKNIIRKTKRKNNSNNKRNKISSKSHSVFRQCLKNWDYWLLRLLNRLIRKSKNWEKDKSCLKRLLEKKLLKMRKLLLINWNRRILANLRKKPKRNKTNLLKTFQVSDCQT